MTKYVCGEDPPPGLTSAQTKLFNLKNWPGMGPPANLVTDAMVERIGEMLGIACKPDDHLYSDATYTWLYRVMEELEKREQGR